MIKFRHAPFLRKYEVPYIFVQPGTGQYDDDGVWKTTEPNRVTLRGNVQPVSIRLIQDEGGRYDEDDMTLYTVNLHKTGDIIEYRGKQYMVDAPQIRDYADVNKYMLKARVANDPV
ncbi:hypothetical protein D3C72_697440 [compost metagenome]